MAALIPILKGRKGSAIVVAHAVVDDEDVALVGAYRWGLVKAPGGLRYANSQVPLGGHTYAHILMHRLILGEQAREHTDHRNGNGLDNRRENLRPCTHAENMQNRNRHPRRGVSRLPSGRWRAKAHTDGRDRHIGVFDTEDEAMEAARAWRAENMPFATN
jgi:hypothetical protein